MGTTITDWANATGPMYTGAGGAEMMWTIVAAVICVVALIVGSKHELSAYRKLKK